MCAKGWSSAQARTGPGAVSPVLWWPGCPVQCSSDTLAPALTCLYNCHQVTCLSHHTLASTGCLPCTVVELEKCSACTYKVGPLYTHVSTATIFCFGLKWSFSLFFLSGTVQIVRKRDSTSWVGRYHLMLRIIIGTQQWFCVVAEPASDMSHQQQ